MKSLFREQSRFRGVWAIALVLSLVATACSADVPQDEDIERTQVIFDSEAGAIPLPSDLALEDDGTLPNLGEGLSSSAQTDFYSYLDTLHGWLPSTGLTIPVDGAIDEETLTSEAVLLFRLGEAAEQLEVADVTFAAAEEGEGGEITIVPAEPLELGTRYGYVLTQAVKDPQGNPLVTAQPIWFQLSSEPLVEVDEEGNIVTDDEGNAIITNSLLAQAATPAEAGLLEQARQLMSPVVEAAVAAGVERNQIVAVSHWHTALDTFAVFQPPASAPFPNEAARTSEDGTVNLPIPEDADQLTTAVLSELNRRDGFSITADGWIPLEGGQLDPATVTPENIPLAWVVERSATLYEPDAYHVTYRDDFEGAGVISYGPTGLPFRQGLTHVGVVTTEVKDTNGWAIKPSPVFVFLRTQHPLVDENGNSTVEQLSDADAQTLSAAADDLQLIFLGAQLPPFSYDLEDLAVAWPFTTDVATEPLQRLSARAEALTAEAGVTDPVGDPTTAEADPSDFDNVGIIQRQAAFTTQWFIDPTSPTGLAEDPTTQPVPVIITVPSEDACPVPDNGYPIVIVGHGLGGSREIGTSIFADALAANPYCLATVSLDFPLHGLRTPDDAESGELFMTANVIATKNNFLQAAVDLSVLTEVIQAERLENALDVIPATDLIDETQIGYTGISLGAMIGTDFLATDGDVTVGALNVPGAGLVDLVLGGDFADQILPQLPGDLEPGTFNFFQTMSFLQWIIEPGDPWTFAPHVINDPLPAVTYDVDSGEFAEGETLPANEVIVQMAGEDTLIPNSTTERLAEAIGISLEDTTFEGASHGFVALGEEGAECAVAQIAAWLSSGLGGDASLPAELENACAAQ